MATTVTISGFVRFAVFMTVLVRWMLPRVRAQLRMSSKESFSPREERWWCPNVAHELAHRAGSTVLGKIWSEPC